MATSTTTKTKTGTKTSTKTSKQTTTKAQPQPQEDKLPQLTARLEAVKGEYQYLQNARNALHTRTGILIALLAAIVAVPFNRNTVGIIDLFKTNIILAHFRVILLVALFVSFFVALISYIRTFFTHTYAVFDYQKYSIPNINDAVKLPNENVIVSIYKDYAKCIYFNQPIFAGMVKHYQCGNRWLLVTIVVTVLTLITTLI